MRLVADPPADAETDTATRTATARSARTESAHRDPHGRGSARPVGSAPVAAESDGAQPESDGPEAEPALSLSESSDDELAAAAAVGDAEAFAELVARMSPILLRYLRRMVPDPQTAEDLAQDTLLDAWKGLPDFAFRSSFRTWMFAIAHRKTIDHRRRRRDIPTADEHFADLAAPEPLPAEVVEQSTLVDALRVELGHMPSTSRAAWWLREVEGLSLAEISRVLQISIGSVRGHLQRSRKFLATRLAPWRPGAGDPSAVPTSPAGDIGPAAASGQHQPAEPDAARTGSAESTDAGTKGARA